MCLTKAAAGGACGAGSNAFCAGPAACRGGVCLTKAAAGGACGGATNATCAGAATCRGGVCLTAAAKGDACGAGNNTFCADPAACRGGVCRTPIGFGDERCDQSDYNYCEGAFVCLTFQCWLQSPVGGRCGRIGGKRFFCGAADYCDGGVCRAYDTPIGGACTRSADCHVAARCFEGRCRTTSLYGGLCGGITGSVCMSGTYCEYDRCRI